MLTPWRRHLKRCPHRAAEGKPKEGRAYTKCNCPIWAEGTLNGRRYQRSLGTRDWQRAIRKLAALEAPDGPQAKPIAEAIQAFDDATADLGTGTKRNYSRSLRFLADLAQARGLEFVSEMTLEFLDTFRASRKVGLLTWIRELQVLRHFFGFCLVRKWTQENPAKLLAMPRNVKPSDKQPDTPNDIAKILAACETIGRGAYERLRSRAMILLLRYTALRISDVATLRRDRIRAGEVYLRTMKNGDVVKLPVHADLQAALDVLPLPRGADGPECPSFFWSGHGSARSMIREATRTLAAVFQEAGVPNAGAHRFRHTLATEVLGLGGTFEDAADILGNSPAIVRKHYAKWSVHRQARISTLLERIWQGSLQRGCNAEENHEESPLFSKAKMVTGMVRRWRQTGQRRRWSWKHQ